MSDKTDKALLRISLGLLTITVLIILVTIWWWALFGLSHEVGTAATITAVIAGLPGLVCLMLA